MKRAMIATLLFPSNQAIASVKQEEYRVASLTSTQPMCGWPGCLLYTLASQARQKPKSLTIPAKRDMLDMLDAAGTAIDDDDHPGTVGAGQLEMQLVDGFTEGSA